MAEILPVNALSLYLYASLFFYYRYLHEKERFF
ncbi:hypothetical protein C823_005095 [Eubacterium plexicaudatum ASF492]|uniref:Uncharacterized protein n=1 Tax=Eubacterium plexicaudatum ASF492 TaxID=1235802 RepID=N1ZQ19_9FIRM|nr:hypothetical protein C823_005095 [Eubacterium plexicaudatum ASF492]